MMMFYKDVLTIGKYRKGIVMAYKLTKEEKEVIIRFDESSDVASLDTGSLSMMRKMEKLRENLPDVFKLVSQDKYGAKYEFSKKLITIRRPHTRKMTDVQKREAAQRLAKARENIKYKV